MNSDLKGHNISENLLEKYVHLNNVMKDVKTEMDKIKHVFHSYFNETAGPNTKAEVTIGEYFIQRQIRVSESYDEERTVQYLEKQNLSDCIKYVKQPDEDIREKPAESPGFKVFLMWLSFFSLFVCIVG